MEADHIFADDICDDRSAGLRDVSALTAVRLQQMRSEIAAKLITMRSDSRDIQITLSDLRKFSESAKVLFVDRQNVDDRLVVQHPTSGPNEQTLSLFLLQWIFEMVNHELLAEFVELLSNQISILHSYDAVMFTRLIDQMIDLMKVCLTKISGSLKKPENSIEIFQFDQFQLGCGFVVKSRNIEIDSSHRAKLLLLLVTSTIMRRHSLFYFFASRRSKQDLIILICIAITLGEFQDQIVHDIIDSSCGTISRLMNITNEIDDLLISEAIENLLETKGTYCTHNIVQFVKKCSMEFSCVSAEALERSYNMQNLGVACAIVEANVELYQEHLSVLSNDTRSCLRDVILHDLTSSHVLKVALLLEHGSKISHKPGHVFLNQLLRASITSVEKCKFLTDVIFSSASNANDSVYEPKFRCREGTCEAHVEIKEVQAMIEHNISSNDFHWKALLLSSSVCTDKFVINERTMISVIDLLLDKVTILDPMETWLVLTLPTSHRASECWKAVTKKTAITLCMFLFYKHSWPIEQSDVSELCYSKLPGIARAIICLSSTGCRFALPTEHADIELNLSLNNLTDIYTGFCQAFRCTICDADPQTNFTSAKFEEMIELAQHSDFDDKLAHAISRHFASIPESQLRMNLWMQASVSVNAKLESTDFVGNLLCLSRNPDPFHEEVSCLVAMRTIFDTCPNETLRTIISQCGDTIALLIGKSYPTIDSLSEVIGDRAVSVIKQNDYLIIAHAFAMQRITAATLLKNEEHVAKFVVKYFPKLILLLTSGCYDCEQWPNILNKVSTCASVPLGQLVLACRQELAKELACGLGYCDNDLVLKAIELVSRHIQDDSTGNIIIDRMAGVLLHIERGFCSIAQNKNQPMSDLPILRRPKTSPVSECWYSIHHECALLRSLRLLIKLTGFRGNHDAERYLSALRTAIVQISRMPTINHCRPALVNILKDYRKNISHVAFISTPVLLSFIACVAEINAVDEIWPVRGQIGMKCFASRSEIHEIFKGGMQILLPWSIDSSSRSGDIFRRTQSTPVHSGHTISLESPIQRSNTTPSQETILTEVGIKCIIDRIANGDDHILQIYLLKKLDFVLENIDLCDFDDLGNQMVKCLLGALGRYSSDEDSISEAGHPIDREISPFSCTRIKLLIGKCLSKIPYEITLSSLCSPATTLSETTNRPSIFPVSSDLSLDDSWLAGIFGRLSISYMSHDTEIDAKHCAAYAIQELFEILSSHKREAVATILNRFDPRSKDIVDSCVASEEGRLIICDEVKIGLADDIHHENWICGTALKLIAYVIKSHPEARETLRILESLVFIITKDSRLSRWLIPGLLSVIDVEDAKLVARRFNDEMANDSNISRVSNAIIETICFSCVSIRQHQMANQNVSMNKALMIRCSLSAFMCEIDKQCLIGLLIKTDAYTDALLELELYVNDSSLHDRDWSLETLQEVYWQLGDQENVTGVLSHYRHSNNHLPSLRLIALAHEAEGENVDAVACYESILSDQNQSAYRLQLCRRYLRSLIAVGQLYTAASLADREDDYSMTAFQMETAWRLGDWQRLHHICKEIDNEPCSATYLLADPFELNVGRVLNAYLNNQHDLGRLMDKTIVNQTELLAEYLSSVNAGLNMRSRKCLIKLQLTNEMSVGMQSKTPFFANISKLTELPDIDTINLWASVCKAVCGAVCGNCIPPAYLADLLINQSRACRIILSNQGAHVSRVNDWLSSSMKSSLSATAARNQNDPSRLCRILLEQAHWFNFGSSHSHAEAISELDRAQLLAKEQGDTKLLAVISILSSRWRTDSASADCTTLLQSYRNACKASEEWAVLKAEANFSLAHFLDYIIGTDQDKNELIVEMCHAYTTAVSLLASVENSGRDQQCLSRMFTHFFNLGTKICELDDQPNLGTNDQRKECSRQLNSIADLIKKLIKSQNVHTMNNLMIIFNQLISRICHPNQVVSQTLDDVLCMLLEAFPERAVWYMVSGSQSTHKKRKQRCQSILTKASRKSNVAATVIKDCMSLCAPLTELCSRKLSAKEKAITSMSLKKHFPKLSTQVKACRLLLPIQKQLFPSSEQLMTLHKRSMIYFENIEDTIEIMKSLQKPKKILVRGTDGLCYPFLCKARDDLRIDQRMIEVCQLLNRCFKQKNDAITLSLTLDIETDLSPKSVRLKGRPQSGGSNLYIRTYSVMPITDMCGIIEMVSGLTTLRCVLEKLYKKYNNSNVYRMGVRQLMEPDSLNPNRSQANYEAFIKKALPAFKPSVLHHWFMSDQFESLSNEPLAYKWYATRMNYCRTAAVMSMVGWMVGLGDRHCENILLDTTNGDCIHVDYNCLFNKGDIFQIPEIVPFRLTHNMVDGMGILGIEGTFRQTCEKVTHLMRQHKDLLLSVLETFVYDPLLEWKRVTQNTEQLPPQVLAARQAAARAEAIRCKFEGETVNLTAKSEIENIRWRLNGHVGKLHDTNTQTQTSKMSSPMSVDGQVDLLIKEATNSFSLAQMFIGWASYM